MPFLHPSKGKIRTNNQIELYQKMNPLACPEGLEQLSKIPRQWVADTSKTYLLSRTLLLLLSPLICEF
jgi:hypothetical protein